MTEIEIFVRLLLALGLGALIGSEREKFAKKADEFAFGGIRTFMFISLLGSLAAFISQEYFSWFVVPVFVGLLVLISIGYYTAIILSKGKSIGLTGEIAALLAFLIGTLTFTDHILLAIATSIIIATFLYLKRRLHKLLGQVKEEEMYSTFIFAIIAFVILPFLPNQAYGPFEVFNPYKIWLMVVFICGLSYIGYILTKIWGSKTGAGITGLLGGMVSSTAVTMTFSGKSKNESNSNMVNMFVFAVLLANAVMFVRVMVEVFVVNPGLLKTLLIPLITMVVVALVCAGFLWFYRDKDKKDKTNVSYESPLSIGPALKFAILFAIVLLVVKLAQQYFGQTGLFIASFVTGLVDVDAITLSVANVAGKTITEKIAATAITIAIMTNTAVKIGYASMFGSKEFRKKVAICLALVILSGLIAIWAL